MLKDEERQRTEIWSRCMGYHRPVSHYNVGKKQEFADRVNFVEPKEN
jgi:anaerobic ribonucleoside-triphosphate reductase